MKWKPLKSTANHIHVEFWYTIYPDMYGNIEADGRTLESAVQAATLTAALPLHFMLNALNLQLVA